MIKKNDPLDILKKKYLKMNHTKMKNYQSSLDNKFKRLFYNVFKKIKIKKI